MAGQVDYNKDTMQEAKLAKVLNVSIAEVFERLPIPDQPQAVGHRIKKKKFLGLDTTKELHHLQYLKIKKDIEKLINEGGFTAEYAETLAHTISEARNEVLSKAN